MYRLGTKVCCKAMGLLALQYKSNHSGTHTRNNVRVFRNCTNPKESKHVDTLDGLVTLVGPLRSIGAGSEAKQRPLVQLYDHLAYLYTADIIRQHECRYNECLTHSLANLTQPRDLCERGAAALYRYSLVHIY